MRTLLAVAVALTLFTAPALAKDDKKKAKGKSAAKSEKVANDDEAAADGVGGVGGSQSARQGRIAGVGLLYTPLSDFILSYGAHGYYAMGSRWHFGLGFLMGSEDLLGEVEDKPGAKLTRADLSGQAFWGYGRFFIGNSFNVSGGLGQRSATVDYRVDGTTTGDYIEGHLEIASIVALAALGNHWTWKGGFTLGCDWVAVMAPLSGGSSAETEGTLSGAEVKKINDDFQAMGEDLSGVTSLTLLLTSAGWIF